MGGCWVRTCDYPGAKYMAVNHYETALFLLWVSDSYREREVPRRVCPVDAIIQAPYHRWARYPHPCEVEARTTRQDSSQSVAPMPPTPCDDDDEDAEIRPIPMVNVAKLSSPDDDDLSSYMEVSQWAVPAPDDGFLPVVHRGSQLQSSQQSVRTSHTAATEPSIAIQQAIVEASIQNRHSLELDSKFDKLDKPENFDWWYKQLQGRLQHEAWKNILSGGEPYATTDANRTVSNKLSQRLNQAMTATIGEAIGGTDEFEGLGLELLQAIINHFIPSESVNLPTIFTEWNELHQKKDELSTVFSARVTRLANRSKRAGQEYTEVSQLLTFIDGLHDGFDDFSKDYFSGRICLTDTTLRDTTALAKTLELTMEKKKRQTRVDANPRRGRARRANGITPDNACVDVTSGPLSRAQVDALFANFKCPLHRVNNHTCMQCYAYGDQGYVITKKPAGAGRRVSGPTPAPPTTTASPAPAPAPTPAPAPPPVPPAGDVTGAARNAHVTFAPDDTVEDDDVSVGSYNEDFAVEYVVGSSKRVALVRPQPFSPYRRRIPKRAESPPVTPPSVSPLWSLLFLLLIIGISWFGAIGGPSTLVSLVGPILHGVGSLLVPGSAGQVSPRCVGVANMAHAVPNGRLGRIQRATTSHASHACVDSGCTTDMCPLRESFISYTPLDNCYVTIANSEKIKCAGRGTVFLKLRDKAVKLANVLHVPDLEMTLLSVRSHRRRGQGCSFLADESGCFLTFPNFVVEIDDSDDCIIPCAIADHSAHPDHCESLARPVSRSSQADAFRMSAKRARGTLLYFSEGAARRVGVPPRPDNDPAELLQVPATVPKVHLGTLHSSVESLLPSARARFPNPARQPPFDTLLSNSTNSWVAGISPTTNNSNPSVLGFKWWTLVNRSCPSGASSTFSGVAKVVLSNGLLKPSTPLVWISVTATASLPGGTPTALCSWTAPPARLGFTASRT